MRWTPTHAKTPKPPLPMPLRALAWTTALLFVHGCTSPGQVRQNAALTNPAPIAVADYPVAFDAGVAVLRESGFGVDRQDFRFGRITSPPQGSPTAVEVWKPDNSTADQALRSTLGNLRRTVTLSFTPVGEGEDGGREVGERGAGNDTPDADFHPEPRTPTHAPRPSPTGYVLGVEVLIERLQVPQRRLNGATQGQVFADLAEMPEELQARGINASYWQPTGRDVRLEQRLLQQILQRTQTKTQG